MGAKQTYQIRNYAVGQHLLTLRRTLEDTAGETPLLNSAALEARAAGQYQRATALLEDAIIRRRGLDNQESLGSGGLGLSLFLLALVRREQGDFTAATALFEDCIALHREIGDREGIGLGLLGLSDIARDQGDAVGVRKYCEESLVILRELEARWAIGFALNNLTLAAYLEGNLAQALALINESVALFRAQKADGSLAEVLITFGQVVWAQEEAALAYQTLIEALQFAWAVGPRLMVAVALEGLASVVVSLKQATLAVHLLAAASTLRNQMGTPVRPVDQPAVERTLASVRATLGADTFAAIWTAAEALPLDRILSSIPLAASLFSTDAGQLEAQSGSIMPARHDGGRVDWGLAQDIPVLYGRADELSTLTQWIIEEQRRVITLIGIGGIGKTSLAITFARQVASHFEAVIFRSLGEAPPLPELLDQLIYSLAVPQVVVPTHISDKLALFIDLLRQTRCLIILDNLETLVQTGTAEAHYLGGYEAYGTLFKSLGETAHQSCLILTSRECPPELASLESPPDRHVPCG
jgi:tetratricopeptide (TPR) repeat protein